MAKILQSLIICTLALFLVFVAGCTQPETVPQASVEINGDSSGDLVVWEDTCPFFECGNESAYEEIMAAPFADLVENMTGVADYSNLSRSSAFLSLNSLMDERYAFKDWRAVDFDALYNIYAPLVATAEGNHDEAAYYLAIREYLYSIPDGHVSVIPVSGDYSIRNAEIGGSYGIGLIQLDSGKVIIDYVAERSEAESAGIAFGNEVLSWNGEEIHDAINSTPYLWAEKKPSTTEGIRLHRQRLLTRAPVGTTAVVSFTDSAGNARAVNLTAFDDDYEGLKKTSFFLGMGVNDYGAEHPWADVVPQMSSGLVSSRILPGGYEYIAIYEESYGAYEPFKVAMLSAIENDTPGIVLDFRYNNGGDDNLAACFAGWFVEKPVFYEFTTTYDPGTRGFTTVSEAWVSPRPERYTGPVAVLVSPDTISSGEGIPMVFSNTGRGKIISWYGTNGAFGMNNVQAIMPPGMYIMFPDGASLDDNGEIQVDSNVDLVGGISPDIRVPLDKDTVSRAMNGEDVQLTYAMEWLVKQQGFL